MTEPPTVADLLRRTLDALGITQAELSRATGLSAHHVNAVLMGKVDLSLDCAARFGRATGIPAQVWCALQGARREWELRDLLDDLLPAPMIPRLRAQRDEARDELARLRRRLMRNGE